MGDEADDWGILVALCCGKRGHDIAILIHCDLL